MTDERDLAYRFFNGIGFSVLVCISVLIGHAFPTFDMPIVLFLCLLTAYGLIFCDTVRVMLPMAFMAYYIVNAEHGPNIPAYSDYYGEPHALFIFSFSGALIIGGLLTYIIRHRRDVNRLSRSGALMMGSILLLSLGFLLNGVGSSTYSAKGTLYAAGLSASFLVFFLLFLFYFKYSDELRDYFMKNIVLTEFVLAMQVFLIYATTVQIDEKGHIIKNSIVTGWGTWASVGCMLAMMMPACFYLAARSKYMLPYFCVGMMGYIAAILSMSRNAWLVASGVLVVSFYLFFRFARERGRAFGVMFFTIAIGAVLLLLLRDQIWERFFYSIELGVSSNGRFSIWDYGFEKFMRAVICGAGFYDGYVTDGFYFEVFPYLFHNTWLQMLASCGLVGFLAYLVHRVVSVCVACRRITPARVFVALSVVSLLLSSLIDVNFFQIYPGIAYSFFMAFFVLDGDCAKDEEVVSIPDLFHFWKRYPSTKRAGKGR